MQFKSSCPPGKYKFPFHFYFKELYTPTMDITRDNLKLIAKYTIIAELEEEPDDSFLEEEEEDEDVDESEAHAFDPPRQELKCHTMFEVFWNYKRHLKQDMTFTEKEYEREWSFMVPRLLCCLSTQIVAEITLPRNVVISGDLLPFELKLKGVSKPSDLEVRFNLFEEVSNLLIDFCDTSVVNLSVSYTKNYTSGGLTFSGEVDYGVGVKAHSQRSSDWNIAHILEVVIASGSSLKKVRDTYKIPCLVVAPMFKRKDPSTATVSVLQLLEETDPNEPLLMTYSKFKLEERYDIMRGRAPLDADEDDMDFE